MTDRWFIPVHGLKTNRHPKALPCAPQATTELPGWIPGGQLRVPNGFRYSHFDMYDNVVEQGDVIDVRAGSDTVRASLSADRIQGGTGDDNTLSGMPHVDLIEGFGDDVLHGGLDNNALHGGDGADFLAGDAGDGSFQREFMPLTVCGAAKNRTRKVATKSIADCACGSSARGRFNAQKRVCGRRRLRRTISRAQQRIDVAAKASGGSGIPNSMLFFERRQS